MNTEKRSSYAQRAATSRPARWFLYGFILFTVVVLLFPFYWVVQTSLKPIDEIYTAPPTWIPQTFTLGSYMELLNETPFARATLNSIVVAVTTTVLSSIFSAVAGFAFAKYQFRGKEPLFLVVLGSMMIPVVVTLIPNYILFVQLRLVNTLWSVILPAAVAPFAIFWMRQYISGAISDNLLEAARLDGANELQIYWKIVQPVITPGLAALAIWVFVQSWNEFLRPLVYLQETTTYTIPIVLSSIRFASTQYRISLDLVAAGAVLSSVPVLLMFVFAQDTFVNGATAGAVKE